MIRPAAESASAPFASLLARKTSSEPLWLGRLRRDARKAFDDQGLPAPGNEDWRQTNVQPLASIPFEHAAAGKTDAFALDDSGLAELAPVRIVLANGRVVPKLSRLDALTAGVRVESLARVLADAPETVEPYLGRIAPANGHPFVALSSALFEDGVVVEIAPGATAAAVHVIHLVTTERNPLAVFPRVLVHAGERSKATVVESFVSSGREALLTSAVTEIVVDANAQLDHVKVQAESDAAWHVATIAARVSRDARFASHNVSWGARLARNDIGAVLDGEGASCHLYGLYLVDDARHVDNHTWLDHAKPHCPSWEMYKGILAGSARAVFNGRIIVREGAQKTDAKQSNKNLILSDGGVVYTRPQLEIYANDVRCTHGATIGRLDDAALFYLRSRGIGSREARDLLVHAFADDVLGKIPHEGARAAVGRALFSRLARDLEG